MEPRAGSRTAAELAGASVSITLKDEDTSVLADDAIGSCTARITAADLAAGRLVLDASRGCRDSVEQITVALRRP